MNNLYSHYLIPEIPNLQRNACQKQIVQKKILFATMAFVVVRILSILHYWLTRYQVKFSAHNWYIYLEQCYDDSLIITSSGLAKTHHSSKLGRYGNDGMLNGHISYKNPAGYYLYVDDFKEWKVSTNYNILTTYF